MGFKQKKIYLLVCGRFEQLRDNGWRDYLPELNIIADVEPVLIWEQKSASMGYEQWLHLSAFIDEKKDLAAGFVILHETDNLLYTAAALFFLNQNFPKPIIFTGSISERNDKNELRANLINATQAATYDYADIGLMFGNRLMRAAQTTFSFHDSASMFTASSEAIIGKIDFSIRIFDKVLGRQKNDYSLFHALNTNVESIELTPLIDIKKLSKRVESCDGLIINASSLHLLTDEILFFIQKIISDKPVLLWSQGIQPTPLSPANLIVENRINFPFAAIKFMWVLAQTTQWSEAKKLMEKNICGELL